METFFAAANMGIGIGIVLIQVAALFLLWGIISHRTARFVSNRALPLAFALSLIAALGTLYYSEIVKVVPCTLCWYQRALLYPQVLIFAYGFFKKDLGVFLYTVVFSVAGLLVALYHISLPLWTSSIFCDPATELCLIQSVRIFGYVTIPVMSASVFTALILLSIIGLRIRRTPHAQVESS